MESQSKVGFDGTQSNAAKVANPRSVRSSDFLLRIAAIAATLTAAIVMGVAKETEQVPIPLGTVPIYIPVTAKSHYSSGFVFFVVANAIACAYATFSLVISIANRAGPGSLGWVITSLDLVVMALLFSGVGAAGAVGMLGAKGNSHLGWNKICHIYGKFCRQAAASVIVSLIGALAFMLLIMLSTKNLHRRSR